MADDLPVHRFASRDELADWLGANAETSRGIWLEICKKGSAAVSVSYADAVELALCHGWIDGQKRALDDDVWLQRLTPRTAQSRWSRINRDKAIALIEAGRMAPAGLAAVEQARADGRWDRAYEGARTITVPDDLQRALAAEPAAAAFFATLDGSNRYAILYRIGDAKKPETRARRIERFVAMLARGEKIHAGGRPPRR
jgi:uncharacterized protein YdeI (YjbR/CyaY-like superfamily)